MTIATAAAAAITIPAAAIIPADNLSTRLHAAGWEYLLPAGCKFAVLYDGKPMVFDCPFKMKPSANSIYDLKDATASFFILVKNTDGGFLIDKLCNRYLITAAQTVRSAEKVSLLAQKSPSSTDEGLLLVQFFGSETSLSTRCPRQPSCLQACRRPDRYLRCAPARTACSGSAYRSLPLLSPRRRGRRTTWT